MWHFHFVYTQSEAVADSLFFLALVTVAGEAVDEEQK